MPSSVYASPPASYFVDQHRGRKTASRHTKNKYIGANVRQAIEQVFNGLGGWEAMMTWAKQNPDMFYGSVVPKLLPAELAESGAGQSIKVIVYGPNSSTPNQSIDITPQPVVLAADEPMSDESEHE